MSTRKKLPDTGIKIGGTKRGARLTVPLMGHVTLVVGYALRDFVGCHAVVELYGTPLKTVAVLTRDRGLQSLLETALATGNFMVCYGQQLTNTSAPGGGVWTVDAYGINSVQVFGM